MTPKEKALELYLMMDDEILKPHEKKVLNCTMIAVKELIISFSNIFDDSISYTQDYEGYSNMCKYWKEVKQELNLMND
jgi:hypothetical protein